MSEHFLQIDEEGYLSSQGLRLDDESFGGEILENLERSESGAYTSRSEGKALVLEAFFDPLVVYQVECCDEGLLKGLCPYGYKISFSPESLFLDEWDILHGRDLRGRAFGFRRSAQVQFFDLLDSFNDDDFTLKGRVHPLKPWWGEEAPLNPATWTGRYKQADTPWDLGGPHPYLPHVLPQLKLNRSRIISLGCGSAHDAAFFAKQGHIVTAVDYSPEAIDRGRELYGTVPNLGLVESDALHLPKDLKGSFDVVFEHTCYCALSPDLRNNLVQTWKSLLSPGGHLMGFFFVTDKQDGPPFGGSEWEIRQRLSPHFDFLYWNRVRITPPKRAGRELFLYAQKKEAR